MNSDDDRIYELTGCLSKCDKYKYSAAPVNELYHFPAKEYSELINFNAIALRFFIPSGEYELREQVYNTVHNLHNKVNSRNK